MTPARCAATAPPMTMRSGARTRGRILVDQLRIRAATAFFTVPGESSLAVLDALHDTPEIDTIVCRQEGRVAYMADADGKMTGRPGIGFVTRGPRAFAFLRREFWVGGRQGRARELPGREGDPPGLTPL